MPLPTPFEYPRAAHARKHAPSGYAQYQFYKPWLRDEFAYRCFYCLTREAWGSSVSGHSEMGVDHLAAKSANEELATDYANLIYVCNDCNRYKGTESLPINPLVAPLGDHLSVCGEGKISACSVEGQEFIDLLVLDNPGRDRLRFDRLQILKFKEANPDDPNVDAFFKRAFGYPADLPDLTKYDPPGGNAVEGSEKTSAHALRKAGGLPDVY